MRYDYATYSTLAKAQASLEESYATGDISPGEKPLIETRTRKTASWSKAKPVYVITLEGF